MTFDRTPQSRIEDLGYARRIARLRGYYYPPGWSKILGASGCTLESVTYRDRMPDFAALDARVYGVSTQAPQEQRTFASKQRLPFLLLSDQDLYLTAALRLPTFRAAGSDHLKRLTLLVNRDREIRGVLYPLPDPAGSVTDALELLQRERASPHG